jgi:hypothetical protein
MVGGTPSVVDREYLAAHPDWRWSYHSMRLKILNQFRADREACKRIQVDGRWVESAGLTLHDLESMADRRARETLERAVARRGDAIEVGRGL